MSSSFLCPLMKIEPPQLGGSSSSGNGGPFGALFSGVLVTAPVCLGEKCPAYVEREMEVRPVDKHGFDLETNMVPYGLAWRCTELNSPWRLK